uniref:Uncharacterized protein n=1 Tax=Angiostrongylus cantonensis TaxID=6313 RepID=A0A0K0D6Z7_ANGCA
MSSSSETRNSEDSDDDESDYNVKISKRHVYRKKQGNLGKKRVLASVLPRSEVRVHSEEELASETTNSGQLRNFERVVNGDDVYKVIFIH